MVVFAASKHAFHLSKEREKEVEPTLHMTDLQKNLRTAIVEIKKAFKSQYTTMGIRLEIIKKLKGHQLQEKCY